MKKLRNWIIGDYLAKVDDVFTRSRIELIYNFVLFYLLNVILFCVNVYVNHYYYHAAILSLSVFILTSVLIALKKTEDYRFAAKILLFNQTLVGVVSYLIQESSMDFVGEFFIVVNILIAFFTLGRNAGFLITAIWFLQIVHCLANDVTKGKFILLHIPKDQVLPPAPFFVMVPFFLCVYIIYQFVKTRAIAEKDILEQKKIIELKNKEITDSIRYAKRIQDSSLPTTKYIDKTLERINSLK
jgi:hypothetical protein